MTNIIITSEMRVGSRWIHYLLADLLMMKPSPEIDDTKIEENLDKIEQYFNEGRIVKFHHATPNFVFDVLPWEGYKYKLIGIVRNPRDRIVSKAFHQRFKPPGKGYKPLKEAETDQEAVDIAFYKKDYQEYNARQFDLMKRGCSTQQYKGYSKSAYIWTAYEWLVDNIEQEINTILRFLGVKRNEKFIKKMIQKNSFKSKSGRKRGNENRKDEWRRKGVNGDYVNWLDDKMLKESQWMFDKYKKMLALEGKEVLQNYN